MRQGEQHSGHGTGDNRWLLNLVNTFERAERLGDTPCDDKVVSALRARLARPASADNSTVARARPTRFQPQY